jgi:hypothetical protein
MKKFSVALFIAAIVFTNSLTAQSFKMGTVAADAGVGFGLYGIRAYSPISNTEITGIAGVGTLPSFDAEFGLMRLIGVGFHYRRGTYGPYSTGKIRGTDFAGMVNFHLANKKDKFDLVIGVGYGFSSMKTPSGIPESLTAKGGLIRVQVAPHLYFSKNIGMFFRVAYNKHLLSNKLVIKENNGKVWTNADGATWNMGGLEFNLGVAFKIDVLNKKEEPKKD